MLRRAWEMQAEARADFIEVFGTDILVLDPVEAPVWTREYHRHRQDKALAELDDETAAQAMNGGPSLDELSSVPEEFRDADTVAVICDETEGLCYYADFGDLDALFADPALARDRTYLSRLREYLNDDSVPPWSSAVWSSGIPQTPMPSSAHSYASPPSPVNTPKSARQ
ncbi:hypothetical protein ACWCQN_47770 [Streptomyces sp. NPDC001984]